MAIVKMKKFTLLAFESDRKKIIRELHKLSNVQLINLQDEKIIEKNKEFKDLLTCDIDSEYAKYQEALSKAKSALEFLNVYMPKKPMIKALREGKLELTLDELESKVENSNWIGSYSKIKRQEDKILEIDAEIKKLKNEIETLTPWESLDVSFQEIKELKKVSCFIGTIHKNYEENLINDLQASYVEVVSRNQNDVNVLIITDNEKKEKTLEVLRTIGFSEFKTEYNDVPMKLILDAKHQIEELQAKKFFVKEELASYEEDQKILQLAYDYYTNKVERALASNNFLRTKNVSTIQGWIADEDKDELKKVCDELLKENYYLEFEEVKEDEIDYVPIKLKNGELVQAFESVTGMYSYPKYNEIDPTPLLTPFYLIFFGLMIADAGYGLLMLIGTAIALKFFKLEDSMKDFMKFFFYLSFPTIFVGAIYGSFFGDFIVLPTKIIDTNNDIMTIIILSLTLGVIQILCGLGIKAYSLIRMGLIKEAFYDAISWIVTLVSIGGVAGAKLLNWPNFLGTFFMITMFAGMVTIILTNGRDAKTKPGQIASGAYALYGISGYVGDLVSYTRLMALGLSGGSIAGAFNLLINTMPGIAGLLFGPLLFVLMHIFNLALSLLGAYVHTARLQYVEYFGKFYEGGGKPFKAFKSSEKYVKIRRN
ncbi:V-type ATP synthase subunit I [Caproiciproducens sp. MSJ-32]|uniref:V-type ATP synthase subunit I n=1 Tax=Caproiciproducens sp. MSJ-32 TaxID=2841527 RepID=UPI001C1264CD|nr:V-type ATP synthase subunit I [Caproiciproducens sp. MSJ-32]MBU5455546.1 V-type ATP synthase subunit I [Caproiciproducens sp. MSJ-32]